MVPYLLASVCFHWEWISATFPRNHFIFSHRFVTSGKMTLLKAFVKSGNFENKESGMIATGYPVHIKVLHNQEIMKEQICQISNYIRTELPSQLNESIVSNNDTLVNLLLARCDVNGAVAVSQKDLQESLADFQTRILSNLENFHTEFANRFFSNGNNTNNSRNNSGENGKNNTPVDNNDIWWKDFEHSGTQLLILYYYYDYYYININTIIFKIQVIYIIHYLEIIGYLMDVISLRGFICGSLGTRKRRLDHSV